MDEGRLAASKRAGAPVRGLVLSVRGRKAVVMLPGGAVHRVRLDTAGAQPGDEISLPNGFGTEHVRAVRFRPAAWLAAAAAVVLIVAVGITAVPLPAVAHVSLEINPGMTVAVDRLLRVVEIVDCDADATALLAGQDVRLMPLGQLASLLAGKAAKSLPQAPDLEYWLVLAATPVNPEQDLSEWIAPGLQKAQARAQEAWRAAVGQDGLPLQGTIVDFPADLIAAAHELGIGPGRYALLLAADEAGIDLSALGSLHTSEVVAALKEAGLVPGQVFRRAADAGDIEALHLEHAEHVKEAKEAQGNQGKGGGQEGNQGTPGSSGGQGSGGKGGK